MSCLFKSVGCVVISREIDRVIIISVDLYKSSVTDFEYRYMRPQESSNRCDVRYFTLTDKNGFTRLPYIDLRPRFAAGRVDPQALCAKNRKPATLI